MSSSKPSIAELRAVTQPPSLIGRRSAEHWAGRLYMRRLSAHVTRMLLDAPVTPNALTVLMMVCGLVGAAVAAVPGLWTAVVTFLLVQVYLLLDCVDGELARWRRATSTAGVFLDRLGHYVVEVALMIGIGFRAGGLDRVDMWAFMGAVAGVAVLLSKAESDLVGLARASAGLEDFEDAAAVPRSAGLRRFRQLAGRVPIHRLVGAVEVSMALIVASVVDVVAASQVGSRGLVIVLASVAVAVAFVHPVMILSSDRLR